LHKKAAKIYPNGANSFDIRSRCFRMGLERKSRRMDNRGTDSVTSDVPILRYWIEE
jgi:hypothetical protein